MPPIVVVMTPPPTDAAPEDDGYANDRGTILAIGLVALVILMLAVLPGRKRR